MSTITKPSRAASKFIGSAPDAKPKAKAAENGRRVQITITVPREILDQFDGLAKKVGQTRAGLFVLAAAKMLRDGV